MANLKDLITVIVRHSFLNYHLRHILNTNPDFLVDDHFSYIKITKKYCYLYYASRVLIDNSRVMLQIVASLNAIIGALTIPDRHKTIL